MNNYHKDMILCCIAPILTLVPISLIELFINYLVTTIK